MKSILVRNTGLSKLIGVESIDILQKAQKVAKAVRVVQNQQRIQLRAAQNHFAQDQKTIPMIICTGMIDITSMKPAPQMNYIPVNSSSYSYGQVGYQKGPYRQYQNPFQHQSQINVKQYPNTMSYTPNRGPAIRYNDQVFGIAVALLAQPKQHQNEEKEEQEEERDRGKQNTFHEVEAGEQRGYSCQLRGGSFQQTDQQNFIMRVDYRKDIVIKGADQD
ncbi:MAG: hypothetical protein EZS28_012528 [Streblomastix strix]|uniref:Uncharacterized protein n=1 Tax=Streblomastix strix TaxID=222440 RepID=A0A5J4WB95_9EUKA|nr:MAG: hypothetical protein EZS28_012528 [Streblomastix strix]